MDPHQRHAKPRRNGCLWIVGIVLLVLLVVVMLNLNGLGQLWSFGKQLFELSASIQEEFDVQQANVGYERHSGEVHLAITLDAREFDELSEDELAARAEAIARYVHQHSDDLGPIDRIKIELETKAGLVSSKQEFSFSPAAWEDTEDPSAPSADEADRSGDEDD